MISLRRFVIFIYHVHSFHEFFAPPVNFNIISHFLKYILFSQRLKFQKKKNIILFIRVTLKLSLLFLLQKCLYSNKWYVDWLQSTSYITHKKIWLMIRVTLFDLIYTIVIYRAALVLLVLVLPVLVLPEWLEIVSVLTTKTAIL